VDEGTDGGYIELSLYDSEQMYLSQFKAFFVCQYVQSAKDIVT